MVTTGETSAIVPAAPSVVFDVITDIGGLPAWNAVMTSVVEQPDELTPGREWVVEFRALGQSWRSRAVIEDLDRAARRFTYRSGTDDGNPSWARWRWTVDEDPAGSRVTVGWELHPVTFWRRTLLVRVRGSQLARREVPESLRALASHVSGAGSPPGP